MSRTQLPVQLTAMWTSTVAMEVLNESISLLRHQKMPGDEPVIAKDTVQKVIFIFAILIIPICIFGCIGNILSLFVLIHHRMRNTTNCCLAALAVSDFLVLFHSLWYSTIIIYKSRDPVSAANLRRLTYPVIGAYGSVVTARITTWLTTLLSIERFVAVYCPMKARTICGKKHTYLGILMIYFVTIIAFLPHALKYRPETVTNNNRTIVILHKTILGKNHQFCAIYGTILNILFRFVPIALLIILNILIVKAIRQTWNLRRIMSKGGNPCNMSEQNRITIMLLIVSFVFLICILPGALNSIASQIKQDYSRLGSNRNLFACISCVTYFLETVNSSINFIIYMAFSAKFCRTYQEIFCCIKPSAVPRSSTREIIRFVRRPLVSTGSSGSNGSREFRLSAMLTDQRRHQFRKSRCTAISSFDMENIKLLSQRDKNLSAESDIGVVQYS
ncbi:FMRFamide peptide receptor frpr-18-like [Haliotis cracherodii]|uniref:FMRFamide peptide receptor frpr-18-like n=1 Tax=Haliotis cracherodii TaxID=6455 RepID=UPI0039E8FF7E